jgi:hypothetical protein
MTDLLRTTAPTIAKGPPDAPGLDWSALRERGLTMIQDRAGATWTDYNAHDPGVTILEQLCYALTDLSHRAGLPIEDLLTAADGAIPAFGRSLHAPWRVEACEPVTADDYRRLLIDRVRGLGNAWLTPAPGTPRGLYEIALYAAPDLPGVIDDAAPPQPDLRRRAERRFVRHRALCEDIGSIRLLRPVPTLVEANVAIARSADPEQVLAGIVYRLGRFLAPEPRRHGFADLAAGEEPPGGLLPRHGYIRRSELGPRRERAAPSELRAEIAAVSGVLGVEAVRLWADGLDPQADGAVALGPDLCFALDAGLSGGALPIVLTTDGRRREVDSRAVRHLLAGLWERHRRTYDIVAERRRTTPQPLGRARDLRSYTSVATHFPAIYGVGPLGLSGGASPERVAQAQQLLGYLALFDRQMVDFLDRLAAFSALAAGVRPDPALFRRPLAEAVPALAPLLERGGPDVEAMYGRSIVDADQELRLLDFLFALHGEDVGPHIPRPPGAGEVEATRQALAVRRMFLANLVRAGIGRGRGLDYRARRARRGIAGVELRARILIGNEDRGADARPRITIVEDILLRPRFKGEDPAPGASPVRPMTITAVVHLPGPPGRDPTWRAEMCAMLRANTPAHVALEVRFLVAREWARFRRLHRMWRVALRERFQDGVDWLSARLRAQISQWDEGRHGDDRS